MPSLTSRFLVLGALSFAALLAVARPAAGESLAVQFGLEKIVLRGDHAPGAGPNSSFHFLSTPAFNNQGEVSFSASVDSNLISSGLWSTSGGSLHLVASEGSQAPGLAAGMRFGNFNTSVFPIVLNDSGVTSFYNNVDTSPLNNGVWNDAGGSVQATAVSRVPAVGLGPNVNLGLVNGLRISQSGAIAFDTTLTGSGVTTSNNRSIWAGYSPETLGLVAREGSIAPGAPAGSVFDNFTTAASGPAVNTANQVAFVGQVRGPSVSASANTGIWSGESESDLHLVAHAGQQAPGMPAGANFANFGSLDEPTINGHGEVAFRGQTTGPGSLPGISSGIWSEAGGDGLRLIASKGDIAPGSTSRFGELGKPVMNNHGATAFDAYLQGVGDDFSADGIWLDQADEGLRAIALAGESAPGTVDASFRFLAGTAINALGQVVFYGALTGPGVNGNNGSGIWMERSPGDVQLIVRTGDSIEVEPGVFKTVTGTFHLALSGEDDGLQRGFNDRGELALELSFNDGSAGIFVFVPEPSSLAIAACGALAMLVLARSSRKRMG